MSRLPATAPGLKVLHSPEAGVCPHGTRRRRTLLGVLDRCHACYGVIDEPGTAGRIPICHPVASANEISLRCWEVQPAT